MTTFYDLRAARALMAICHLEGFRKDNVNHRKDAAPREDGDDTLEGITMAALEKRVTHLASGK